MNKFIVMAAASLVVSACQTADRGGNSEPQATKAELTAAMQRSGECQINAVRRVDDRRSDVRTIARTVASRCRSEMRQARFVFAMHEGMSPTATAYFMDMDHADVDLATQVVVLSRSQSRR